jgi:hypothetical protein
MKDVLHFLLYCPRTPLAEENRRFVMVYLLALGPTIQVQYILHLPRYLCLCLE